MTRIIANLSGVAKWSFNVTSNSKNFAISGKSPNQTNIVFGTTNGKFLWQISREKPFMYEVVLRIINVSKEDEGPYNLQFKLDEEVGITRTVNLYLAVQGNILLE